MKSSIIKDTENNVKATSGDPIIQLLRSYSHCIPKDINFVSVSNKDIAMNIDDNRLLESGTSNQTILLSNSSQLSYLPKDLNQQNNLHDLKSNFFFLTSIVNKNNNQICNNILNNTQFELSIQNKNENNLNNNGKNNYDNMLQTIQQNGFSSLDAVQSVSENCIKNDTLIQIEPSPNEKKNFNNENTNFYAKVFRSLPDTHNWQFKKNVLKTNDSDNLTVDSPNNIVLQNDSHGNKLYEKIAKSSHYLTLVSLMEGLIKHLDVSMPCRSTAEDGDVTFYTENDYFTQFNNNDISKLYCNKQTFNNYHNDNNNKSNLLLSFLLSKYKEYVAHHHKIKSMESTQIQSFDKLHSSMSSILQPYVQCRQQALKQIFNKCRININNIYCNLNTLLNEFNFKYNNSNSNKQIVQKPLLSVLLSSFPDYKVKSIDFGHDVNKNYMNKIHNDNNCHNVNDNNKNDNIMKEKKNKSKGTRKGSLPKEAVTILKEWLIQNLRHPYPTEEQKNALAHKTGLTHSQVNYWFINARVRIWRPMIESKFENNAGLLSFTSQRWLKHKKR